MPDFDSYSVTSWVNLTLFWRNIFRRMGWNQSRSCKVGALRLYLFYIYFVLFDAQNTFFWPLTHDFLPAAFRTTPLEESQVVCENVEARMAVTEQQAPILPALRGELVLQVPKALRASSTLKQRLTGKRECVARTRRPQVGIVYMHRWHLKAWWTVREGQLQVFWGKQPHML